MDKWPTKITEQEIVKIADPKVLQIPIIENNDPVIDLKKQSEICYVKRNISYDYTLVRKTILQRLIMAQKNLPSNLKFSVYEGYRNLYFQDKLFADRLRINMKNNKHLSEDQLYHETVKLVSPVFLNDGRKNVPPHSTGAAIDIVLIDKNGEFVDMGILPEDAALDKTGEIIATNSKKISNNAQENRKILANALTQEGFINYKTEYWHWSYGDCYWAYHTGHSHALFGSIDDLPSFTNTI